jgi:hypothetical protein
MGTANTALERVANLVLGLGLCRTDGDIKRRNMAFTVLHQFDIL